MLGTELSWFRLRELAELDNNKASKTSQELENTPELYCKFNNKTSVCFGNCTFYLLNVYKTIHRFDF